MGVEIRVGPYTKTLCNEFGISYAVGGCQWSQVLPIRPSFSRIVQSCFRFYRSTVPRRLGAIYSGSPIKCAASLLFCTAILSCGSGTSPKAIPPTIPSPLSNLLTQIEVQKIVQAAAGSINVPLTIAVSDRRGQIIAVYSSTSADPHALVAANFGVLQPADEVAAALARSAAFFSNDQAPISSRTVRFVSGIHFAPGTLNAEAGPLYGIENTNRGCGFNTAFLPGQSVPVTTLLHNNSQPGLGIITGKSDLLDSDANAVNPGGVPIFKNNRVAGGIGVVTASPTTNYNAVVEYAAVAGTIGVGFAPTVPYPGAVVLDGFTLPFVDQTTMPTGYSAGDSGGGFSLGPFDSSGAAPEGDLIQERASTLGGLALPQVQQIMASTVATANLTRAALRLPVGVRARFVIAIADLDGSLLALYRMPDATMFSVDVAIAKARTVAYFSGTPDPADLPGGPPAGTAITTRTVGFAAQPFYPSGVEGTAPGPFFPLFVNDIANPCTMGSGLKSANQNGAIFFPGSTPLYVNGRLAGALGVSGDGVDQDDYVSAGGAADFEAPTAIRADHYFDRSVRLTYQKFPPNPTD
jgi:uncharacterized protein GlcG (DUF336 family)